MQRQLGRAGGTTRPRPADVSGQNELVPKAKQLVDVDVAKYVLVVALAQDLLVDPHAVSPLAEVIGLGWAAPTDPKRKLDDPVCLLDRRALDVVRHGHRASVRA